MLIPWPSKAEHGEKIQPFDDMVPVVFDVEDGEGWCTCDEGETCPYHAQYSDRLLEANE